jgi:Mg-chelatase subunit ChlD
MSIEEAFEDHAQDILQRSEQYLRCTEIAKSHAEAMPIILAVDLEAYMRAASNLEAAARNLRLMCTSGYAMRHQAEISQPIPALTAGA